MLGVGRDAVGGVPTPNGTTMGLNLSSPVELTPAPGGADSEFDLELTIATPGSYAVTAAELQYTPSRQAEA